MIQNMHIDRLVSQMRVPLAACGRPTGSYDKTTVGAICFLT